jgi:hypothetical protein
MSDNTYTLLDNYNGSILPISGLDDTRFSFEVFGPHTEGECSCPSLDCEAVDDDTRAVRIIFTEPLEFHREHTGNSTLWDMLTDEDGFLTDTAGRGAIARLAELVSKMNNGMVWETERESYYEFDEEPTLAIGFSTKYKEGMTVVEWWNRAGWPIVSAVISASDPGTYGVPYWFNEPRTFLHSIEDNRKTDESR